MKKGFFGKDIKFWIGQVPLYQYLNKVDQDKWGDRVKVRIMGYHPAEGSKLPDSKLPWAIVLRPNSQGSMNNTSTGIVGGEFVVGFFLDDDCTEPCIIGVMAKTGDEYDLTPDQVQQRQSTEFKRVQPFHGVITAPSYSTRGGAPPQSQQPTIPSPQDMGLSPDSAAATGQNTPSSSEPTQSINVNNLPQGWSVSSDGLFVVNQGNQLIGGINDDGTVDLEG